MINFPVIYMIRHKYLDISYIGSTYNIYGRLTVHKCRCQQKHDLRIYNAINDNGGWDNFDKIVLKRIEESVSPNELKIIEQEYINLINPLMNERKSYITQEQLKQYNKLYQQSYRNKHKDKYLEYQKEYREKNKKHK